MDRSLDDGVKTCPQCGHVNKATARFCVQCGYAFFTVTANGTVRKRCAHCGQLNRMGAKVCSNCGSAFEGVVMVSRGSGQKWCPRCGRERIPGAKVCSQCGYRFKATPVEPPVIQTPDLGEEPVTPTITQPIPPIPDTASTPSTQRTPTADLSGEPAPYLPDDELNRLRGMSNQHVDVFVRLADVFRPDKD